MDHLNISTIDIADKVSKIQVCKSIGIENLSQKNNLDIKTTNVARKTNRLKQ